jgi:hypothetical protein
MSRDPGSLGTAHILQSGLPLRIRHRSFCAVVEEDLGNFDRAAFGCPHERRHATWRGCIHRDTELQQSPRALDGTT